MAIFNSFLYVYQRVSIGIPDGEFPAKNRSLWDFGQIEAIFFAQQRLQDGRSLNRNEG